jgi:hypothetical protein
MDDSLTVWAFVLVPLLMWPIVSPKSAWRIFEAWRFANPDTVRPSAAGYAARRFIATVALAALVVLVAAN